MTTTITSSSAGSVSATEPGAKRKSSGSRIIYYGKLLSVDDDTVCDSTVGNSESEVKKIDDEFSNPNEAPQKLDLGSMKAPVVDVIVRNAVSPLNFTIQNYRQSKNLKILETEMTSYYEKRTLKEFKFSDLILHGYYAVKYISNSPAPSSTIETKDKNSTDTKTDLWMRCQIMKPFNENMPVLTYLIDHGIYQVTEPELIRPLRKIYLSLTVQSYEAKLHFLEGSGNQFTPEDCIRFQKEVEGKSFCAILIPKSQLINPKEDKCSLILVDTSKNKDEYIHQQFLPNKIGMVKGRS